jgi:hypothetical protein
MKPITKLSLKQDKTVRLHSDLPVLNRVEKLRVTERGYALEEITILRLSEREPAKPVAGRCTDRKPNTHRRDQ